jgi:hypothetical protein
VPTPYARARPANGKAVERIDLSFIDDHRSVLLPLTKVVVNRAAWWQIVRGRAPLAAGAQHIHQTVQHLAHIDGPLVAASLGTRDLRFGQ